jgi:hypothetical protein
VNNKVELDIIKIMTGLYILAGIVIILAVASGIFKAIFGVGEVEKAKYRYNRKDFFLTRAEHEFYNVLVEAVSAEYRIFAQVHLPTLLDHSVRGKTLSPTPKAGSSYKLVDATKH